ncbi:CHC2 zinc finger domain-containing protein [Halomonas campaniensis]|uniref:Zinc finger CHC2-type domain-containing protein n=1 Tax=Halomonas campaniensis TaxID=213554 RepID=A0A246S459_9GAMM|nr:CHC2 zinc finger domain-containing protein [Halomonas campaniensis]OWV31252.1 hypothetical protein JI62_02595 [Halomonas campaniensis]
MAEFINWSGGNIKHVRGSAYFPELIEPEVRYKQISNVIVAHYPFHEDSKPSLAVYDRHFIFFIDTSVKKANAIEWLKRNNSMSFQEDITLSAQKAHFSWESLNKSSYQNDSRIFNSIISKIFILVKLGFINLKICDSLSSQYIYNQPHETDRYKHIVDGKLTKAHHSHCMLLFSRSALSGRPLKYQIGVEQCH